MCKVTSLALTLASVQHEIPKKIRLIQNLIVILLLVYLTFSLSSTVKSPLNKPFRRGRHYVRPPKQSFQNTIHSWKRPASISYGHRMSMFWIFSFTTCFLVEFISNGKEINAPLSKLILLASFGNILYPSPSPPPPQQDAGPLQRTSNHFVTSKRCPWNSTKPSYIVCSASGNIYGLGKQNSLFPAGPVTTGVRSSDNPDGVSHDLARKDTKLFLL